MKKLLLFLMLSFSSYAAQIPWTIVIFMNADNDLCYPYAQNDLIELKSHDVSDKANIVVVYDCVLKNDSRIFTIVDGVEYSIELGYGPEFDMGDYKFLSSVSTQLFMLFPSDYKMLIMWNHGSGLGKSRNNIVKGISYDDQSRNNITIPQMRLALEDMGIHLDILGYDACLMQMIEIAYETALYANYNIGSEYSEPGDGWDYYAITKALLNEDVSPVTLGKEIVRSFVEFYKDEEWNIQLSMVDNKALIEFTELLALKRSNLREISPWAYQAIYWSYRDFGSFVDWTGDAELKDAFSKIIVYNEDNNGKTSGLSGYFTKYPYSGYANLLFVKKTDWYNYLMQ